jgi:GNAT superfamily N-acetyltransferase
MEYGELRGFVDDFFVAKQFRRRGLGALALQAVREECTRRGEGSGIERHDDGTGDRGGGHEQGDDERGGGHGRIMTLVRGQSSSS